MPNQRERLAVRTVDGHAVTIPVIFYAGTTLKSASDKTPKAMRKGNYYVPVSRKSNNGVEYNSVIPIDKYNHMVQVDRCKQIPTFRR